MRSGLLFGLILITSAVCGQELALMPKQEGNQLSATTNSTVPIIPRPVHLLRYKGVFLLDGNTRLQVAENSRNKEDVEKVLNYFNAAVGQISGYDMTGKTAEGQQSGRLIELKLASTKKAGSEGYQLSVTPEKIRLQANEPAGLFYGVQSLLQTLPAIRTNQLLQIPCMEILDYPRFKWRGMMLDVSRHFFSPKLVKQFIDLLSTYKMNTFHWHLVDGAGWRIDIKKYPKLTSLAAWRVEDFGKTWNWADILFNADRSKATYGGYYSQEQIKDIVAYAADRHITVVPEIEMPGHSEAAMAAYPQYSCLPHKQTFEQSGDFHGRDVLSNYCPGNDSSFVFLQNILTEVMALFPSKYIHLGGDEVDKTSWENCPRCQRRMKEEKLKDVEELQSYFMQRMEKFVVAHGRKMIGWDEILEGGLAEQATVMSWRGEAGGIKAAKMDHDVVMSPGKPLYFDHYQGDPKTEPLANGGGFNTLKMVYQYDPVPDELKGKAAGHVLGAQANLWTEFIPTFNQVEYMVLPRLLALSEVVWSPEQSKNWKGFNERLQSHLKGFGQKGLPYSKGNFKVNIIPEIQQGKLKITLETEKESGVIFYTMDGSDPGTGSMRYDKPFMIDRSTTIKAGLAIDKSMVKGRPAKRSFTFNKATGKPLQYKTPNSRYYPADGPGTLTDGLRGTNEIGKNWHAFSGNDMMATVDLGSATKAGHISLGCLQQYDQWIFFPKSVRFEVSMDGEKFTEIAQVKNTVPVDDRSALIKDFSADFNPRSFRYLRITAENLGKCPPGHPGAGGDAWLFCDEIIVE